MNRGCPCCGGREFVFMGKLGSVKWYRCRACAAEFSVP